MALLKLFNILVLRLIPMKLRNMFGGRYVDVSSVCDLELDKSYVMFISCLYCEI